MSETVICLLICLSCTAVTGLCSLQLVIWWVGDPRTAADVIQARWDRLNRAWKKLRICIRLRASLWALGDLILAYWLFKRTSLPGTIDLTLIATLGGVTIAVMTFGLWDCVNLLWRRFMG